MIEGVTMIRGLPNNRLKLAARGRSTRTWRLRSGTAA